MRKFLTLLIFIVPLLSGCSQRTQVGQGAQELPAPKRVEILLLGHNSQHHNSEKFVPMLALPLFQKGINLTYTADPNDLNSENLAKYDGLMIYANHDRIAPEQEQAMKSFVEGGKALIPLHSASYCFRNSDWYVSAVGGQFQTHKVGTFTVPIIKPAHEVMQGLTEFETWDETYVHTKLNPDIEVLMERVEGSHREPWTWVRKQGKGKVFYTAYGHDERTWGNPGFHELVANGVLWAISDEAKDQLARLEIPVPVFEDKEVPNYERRDPAPRFQHALTPEQSQKLIQVPTDFDLQLFASEPDIINPIAMAWDEKGRLFVIETVDYPNEVRDEDGVGRDRIKICEDTNGDGKADKFTVFADNLNIPTSLTFANGGVIVSMAPHFLFLKDTNGDDKADVKEVMITGWGKSDTHAGPSNLKYGLDNKVWGVVGYAGYKGAVDGRDMSFSQALYRFDPDGQNLEPLGRTTNNTWGLGFSEEFDVFVSTANGLHSAYFAMPNQYVKRAVLGGSGNTVYRTDSHFDMPHVTPYLRQVDFHGGYTAAAGHNMYTARDYPKSYWNKVGLVCEPTGRVLHKAILEPKGAGYTEKNGFNLLASADEWFSPVHAEVGPDGAIWVADWYNFIIQHNPTPRGFENGKGNAYINPMRDSQHGRIYRVVYKGSKPYQKKVLAQNDTESLLTALKDDNMFWRTTAQRLIVENQNKAVIPGLLALIKDQSVDEIGLNSPAVHALWTLHGLGELQGTNKEALAVVKEALKHPAAGVRKNALQVLPRNQETMQAILQANLLNDQNLKTRMAAVLALADMPASPEIGKLLFEASQKPDNAGDDYLAQAFFAAALTHQEAFLKSVPKDLALNKPDSVLTLTERLVKSMDQEQYVVDRWTQIIYPPDVAGKEITVKVSVGPNNDGLEGVIISQGSKNAGYSLYVQDKKLHWVVNQNGKSYTAVTSKPLPEERVDVVARLAYGGEMLLEVNDETAARAKAPALFTASLSPQDVRVGRDLMDDNRVGNYPERFFFRGDLKRYGQLELKKAKPTAATTARTAKQGASKTVASTASKSSPVAAKPKAGSASAKAVTINIKVVEHEMKFNKTTLTVKAGQKVTLQFDNPDFMQHNFVLIAPGSLEKVGKAADLLARDPKGAEKHYVPKMQEVIVATRLVDPQGRETLVFTAPDKPGEYPFVCTVPGHWRMMNGIMKVEAAASI
ncbi:PVC-type heme-binding CxxCH protein [Pontibacter sp. SGAir0037]|uniref:PVC-type heme-binding CxxCH protein n=1 Tax=Pontibacter sp. SGAir0037 TaxID=2571030 RepID=UPI0010CD4490|nr:PVC-type heme-binding CxxCH protein [Pontibacter sp. SGAir0037]QCR22283.1 dehydrogenase [Pontibacter sp. SGAir0037]